MGLALLRALHQQCLDINDQHHAIECAATAFAPQPVQQVQPQARVDAGRQHWSGFAIGLNSRVATLLFTLTSHNIYHPIRLAEQLTWWIDQYSFIADPPINRIGQAVILVCPGTRPGDMGQRKTLVGARDQAGLACVLFAEHKVPRQLIKRTATLHIIQQSIQATV
ncbi:hypothetical protein D3C81_1102220 [compost metagenome]